MNIPIFIASAVGFIAAELLIAIAIGKTLQWLSIGSTTLALNDLDAPDAYLRKAYQRASDDR